MDFGERSGLNSAMLVTFRTIIWTLEGAYNTWARGEQDRHTAQTKPSPAARLRR